MQILLIIIIIIYCNTCIDTHGRRAWTFADVHVRMAAENAGIRHRYTRAVRLEHRSSMSVDTLCILDTIEHFPYLQTNRIKK